jgi:UDP-glucuronate decarboxylase
LPLPSDDPIQRQPDISMAEAELEWRPQVKLEVGLVSTIAYFQKMVSS